MTNVKLFLDPKNCIYSQSTKCHKSKNIIYSQCTEKIKKEIYFMSDFSQNTITLLKMLGKQVCIDNLDMRILACYNCTRYIEYSSGNPGRRGTITALSFFIKSSKQTY